jgi:hypothetical protein
MSARSMYDDPSDQLKKYLRFFRMKQDGIIRAIKNEINEVQHEKLHEEMYTKDDVTDFADYVSSTIQVPLINFFLM